MIQRSCNWSFSRILRIIRVWRGVWRSSRGRRSIRIVRRWVWILLLIRTHYYLFKLTTSKTYSLSSKPWTSKTTTSANSSKTPNRPSNRTSSTSHLSTTHSQLIVSCKLLGHWIKKLLVVFLSWHPYSSNLVISYKP